MFLFVAGDIKQLQEKSIGETWELELDKKSWDEGGEFRDWDSFF